MKPKRTLSVPLSGAYMVLKGKPDPTPDELAELAAMESLFSDKQKAVIKQTFGSLAEVPKPEKAPAGPRSLETRRNQAIKDGCFYMSDSFESGSFDRGDLHDVLIWLYLHRDIDKEPYELRVVSDTEESPTVMSCACADWMGHNGRQDCKHMAALTLRLCDRAEYRRIAVGIKAKKDKPV